MSRRRPPGAAGITLMVFCLALLLPLAAHAQGQPRQQGPQALWSQYPLTPKRDASLPVRSGPAPPAAATTSVPDSGGFPLFAVLFAVAFGLTAGMVVERRRRRRPIAMLFHHPSGSVAAPPRPWDALQPHPRPPAGDVFERTPWPAAARDQWRCEVVWVRGYANSRFRAVAIEPGSHRRRTLADTDAFKWLLKRDPDPVTAGVDEELAALVRRVESRGWKPTEHGTDWWSYRFVWTRAEPPLHSSPSRAAGHAR